MKINGDSPRVAILGFGAIGKQVLDYLVAKKPAKVIFGVFERNTERPHDAGAFELANFSNIQDLLDWKPTLAIECAGHAVVHEHVPTLLAAGTDVLVISVGALADTDLRKKISDSECLGSSRMLTVSGAIGGLDALQAASGAGLGSVRYTGRKPPLAWAGTPAETQFDLASICNATTIFQGNASDAARLFPKNANVTAAVALAGVGFDETNVQLVADPDVTQNIHELDVVGDFGEFQIRLANQPLPDNPKTSWLAALSIQAELKRYFK